MKRILPVLLAALLLAACGESAAVSSAPSRAPSVSAPPASVPAVSSQSVSQPEPQPGPALPQDWETLSAEQTADLFTALGAEDGRTGWRLADDAAWTKDDGFAYPVTTFEKGEAGWSVTTFSVFGSGARRRVVDLSLIHI